METGQKSFDGKVSGLVVLSIRKKFFIQNFSSYPYLCVEGSLYSVGLGSYFSYRRSVWRIQRATSITIIGVTSSEPVSNNS